MNLSDILNTKFALRKLLINNTLHKNIKSIHKDLLTIQLEPEIRGILSLIATEILKNPDIILIDKYNLDERKKDWNTLVKKNVIEENEIIKFDSRSRPGHKILDHYMSHFYDVKNYKGKSVSQLFTQENLEKALLTNLSMHTTPYKSEIRRMIIMTNGLSNVTKYRAIITKGIVEFFKAKRVFDPCAGWGGRMIGTLAAKSEYVGCEPDKKTAIGLKNILEDLSIPEEIRKKGVIFNKTAEFILNSGTLKNEELFDIILTSPPYFNLEIYTNGEQSINMYPTWDEWVEKWLKNIILESLKHLNQMV